MDVAQDPPRGEADAPGGRPTLAGLIDQLRAAASARLHLFELEAKRAAWSAAYMLAFAVAAGLLSFTAWLLIVATLIGVAVAAGVAWWLAMLVAIVLHGLAAFLLLRQVKKMVDHLTFAATRRTFERRPEPVDKAAVAAHHKEEPPRSEGTDDGKGR